MSESETLSIGRFFCQVQDINRGLDNAAEMLGANNLDGLKREYERNLLKAKRLIEPTESEKSPHAEALGVIEAKVALPWWRY
ncbi:MAG: hypothetical protein ACJ8NR_14035 [Sulfurifustis sp.]